MKVINNLDFELYYSDNYCQSFKSLDTAIKMAVSTYKNNPEMKDRKEFYLIKNRYTVIVTVKFENNQLVIS